jgi:hypothetical protein
VVGSGPDDVDGLEGDAPGQPASAPDQQDDDADERGRA